MEAPKHRYMPNLLKNQMTYTHHDGTESSIDVIATNSPGRILDFKKMEQDTTIHSDHEIWCVTVDEKWNKQLDLEITSKKKLKYEASSVMKKNDFEVAFQSFICISSKRFTTRCNVPLCMFSRSSNRIYKAPWKRGSECYRKGCTVYVRT